LSDRSIVQKQVSDREHAAPRDRRRVNLLRVGRGQRERLLDKQVLASIQCAQADSVVTRRIDCHDDRGNIRIPQGVVEVGGDACVRVGGGRPCALFSLQIADPAKRYLR
jgi:hypothetical protein